MRFNNLSDWLAWQETLHINEIDLGLERCTEVARNMGLKQPEHGFVSVAGTNGKGSSVAMLSAIVAEAGYKVATYTSPHLIRYNERIRIDGEPVSDELLCEAFQCIDDARGDISITYFEFGTLAAYYILNKVGIDFAVMEVGLGGRLDAVNMMDADVALVTSIAIDHVDWLGSDREVIGREKAGIMRGGHHAVCSDNDIPNSVIKHAEEIGTELHVLNRDFYFETTGESTWSWKDDDVHYVDLPRPALKGEFQLTNASGVLKVIQCLKDRYAITEDHIRAGLQKVELAGRFQVIPGPVEYVLDVAHNPHAAQALADFLKSNPVKGKNHLLFGMLKDKDALGVIEIIAPFVDDWYVAGLVDLGGTRGATSELLVGQLEESGLNPRVFSFDTVYDAYKALQQESEEGDRVMVAGSFLTVSEVMKIMDKES